jgi:hypothetical protein
MLVLRAVKALLSPHGLEARDVHELSMTSRGVNSLVQNVGSPFFSDDFMIQDDFTIT